LRHSDQGGDVQADAKTQFGDDEIAASHPRSRQVTASEKDRPRLREAVFQRIIDVAVISRPG
jgi:hypothetical protein